MIENKDIISSSIIQSTYKFFDICLQDFKKLQPEFNYTFHYGTNLDNELSTEDDIFNIVLYTGSVDKIPSYFQEVNGIEQILYAGYLDVSLSIVNPIPLNYTNDLKIHTEKEKAYTSDFSQIAEENYGVENILSDEDEEKIQFGTRMLEALSLFLTRKSMTVDNFKISVRADMPVVEGQFELGRYRLIESITPICKFALQNDLGKALYSGEDLKIWASFLNDDYSTYGNYYEFYNVLETSQDTGLISKKYPIFGEQTIKGLINQITRNFSLTLPDFKLGATEQLQNIINNGDLRKFQDVKFKIYDGKNYYEFYANIDADSRPTNIDKYTSRTLSIMITSELEEVGE